MNREKFDSRKSRQILLSAIDLGIHSYDTAPDYGSAEDQLGEVLGQLTSNEVFTKIPKMTGYTIEKVLESCQNSMVKLKRKKLSGVLFHDPNAHKIKELVSISKEILSRGITDKIGFSAYTKEELIEGKKKNPSWNFFQLSENIANRSNLHSDELKYISDTGNTIQVRSTFLQGLLLAQPETLPTKFSEVAEFSKQLNILSKTLSVKPLDLCLSYTSRISWASSTVIAAATVDQLRDNVNYKEIEIDFDSLPKLNYRILDPRNW